MEERSRRRKAVGKFVDAAQRQLGGRQELADWLGHWEVRVKYQAVGQWITGRNDPPAWVLFLVADRLDLSLDDFAAGENEHGHGRRLEVLEEQVARLLVRYGVDGAAEGP